MRRYWALVYVLTLTQLSAEARDLQSSQVEGSPMYPQLVMGVTHTFTSMHTQTWTHHLRGHPILLSFERARSYALFLNISQRRFILSLLRLSLLTVPFSHYHPLPPFYLHLSIYLFLQCHVLPLIGKVWITSSANTRRVRLSGIGRGVSSRDQIWPPCTHHAVTPLKPRRKHWNMWPPQLST